MPDSCWIAYPYPRKPCAVATCAICKQLHLRNRCGCSAPQCCDSCACRTHAGSHSRMRGSRARGSRAQLQHVRFANSCIFAIDVVAQHGNIVTCAYAGLMLDHLAVCEEAVRGEVVLSCSMCDLQSIASLQSMWVLSTAMLRLHVMAYARSTTSC